MSLKIFVRFLQYLSILLVLRPYEIELLNEKDCSLHAVLRVPPKTDLPCILQRF